MKRRNRKPLLKNIIKSLPVIVAVAAVFYAVQLLSNIELPEVLPVKQIQVTGDLNFLHKDEITAMVWKNISGGYFTVDLKHVRDILVKQPWVKQVALRRQWPQGIDVVIEEKKPIAYWNDEGFISSTGEVFKPHTFDKTMNLPSLNGPEGQHKNVWKFMNEIYHTMASLHFEVKRLRLDERRAWQLEIVGNRRIENINTKNDISVRLGRFDTEKRMQRFVRILPALASEMNDQGKVIKAIDMRYPNGFAVQADEA